MLFKDIYNTDTNNRDGATCASNAAPLMMAHDAILSFKQTRAKIAYKKTLFVSLNILVLDRTRRMRCKSFYIIYEAALSLLFE